MLDPNTVATYIMNECSHLTSPNGLTSPEIAEAESIVKKIQRRSSEINSMAGVGIDPVHARIPLDAIDPNRVMDEGEQIYRFCKEIIKATHLSAVDYKINANFFQSSGARLAMERTFHFLKEEHPNIIRVCDGKFADVGHTAQSLAHYIYSQLDADAVLLNPYLGHDALAPFLDYADKAVVLCINTSNPGANDVQNLRLQSGEELWMHILKKAMREWNKYDNIIPLLSATHLKNLEGIRAVIGDCPVVLAGIGQQGGNLRLALPHVLDSRGYGAMISSSRSILYPLLQEQEEYFQGVQRVARELKEEINLTKSQIV